MRNTYKKEIYWLTCNTLKPFLRINAFFDLKLYNYLLNLSKASSLHFFTQNRNICLLTGRSRSVYRLFKLSRLKVREYAHRGYFVGLSKAS